MDKLQPAIERWVGYVIDWESTAAWAQAFGAIFAILISTAVAIYVPLRMRDIEERGSVQRAINNLIISIGLTRATWIGLKQIIDGSGFAEHTPRVIGGEVHAARGSLAEVPRNMCLGSAFSAVSQVQAKLLLLEEMCAAMLSAGGQWRTTADSIDFNGIAAELSEVSADLAYANPRKIGGHWMIATPGDESELSRIKVKG